MRRKRFDWYKLTKFGIRKLTIGVVSIAIGGVIVGPLVGNVYATDAIVSNVSAESDGTLTENVPNDEVGNNGHIGNSVPNTNITSQNTNFRASTETSATNLVDIEGWTIVNSDGSPGQAYLVKAGEDGMVDNINHYNEYNLPWTTGFMNAVNDIGHYVKLNPGQKMSQIVNVQSGQYIAVDGFATFNPTMGSNPNYRQRVTVKMYDADTGKEIPSITEPMPNTGAYWGAFTARNNVPEGTSRVKVELAVLPTSDRSTFFSAVDISGGPKVELTKQIRDLEQNQDLKRENDAMYQAQGKVLRTGDIATVELTAENKGQTVATGISLKDRIPAGLEIVPDSLEIYNGNGEKVTVPSNYYTVSNGEIVINDLAAVYKIRWRDNKHGLTALGLYEGPLGGTPALSKIYNKVTVKYKVKSVVTKDTLPTSEELVYTQPEISYYPMWGENTAILKNSDYGNLSKLAVATNTIPEVAVTDKAIKYIDASIGETQFLTELNKLSAQNNATATDFEDSIDDPERPGIYRTGTTVEVVNIEDPDNVIMTSKNLPDKNNEIEDFVQTLPKGTYTLKYKALDADGNYSNSLDTTLVVVDKTELKEVIAHNPKLDDKTEDSVNNYQEKLEEAKRIENDPTATQDQIDKATADLKRAEDELVKKPDTELYDPKVPADKVPVEDLTNLTDEEKETVKDKVTEANPDLPENTEISVGDNGEVTVTYPDGTTDTIPGESLVREKTDAEKNDPKVPADKVPVEDLTNLTDEEKETVKDKVTEANPDLPENTEISVGDNGEVTVTYPDGTTDTIPGESLVREKTDAEKNEPKVPEKTPVNDKTNLTPEEQAEVKKKVEEANPDLPENTEITVGKDGAATITYPDGTTDTIPGESLVREKTDADKYEPQGQGQTVNVGEVPKAEQSLGNLKDLPEGTKVTYKEEVDTTTPGNKSGIVVVTYPDGSTEEVPVTIVVKDPTAGNQTDADKYDPLGKDQVVQTGQGVEVSNSITNMGDLPEGTTISWKAPIDTTTPGSKPGIVVVTYPDGSTEEVPVTIVVKDPTAGNQTDADKYDPLGKDQTVNVGEVPKAGQSIGNLKDLPEGTTISWKVPIDTSAAGEVAGTVVVTYPDGSTEEVAVKVIVKDPKAGNQMDMNNQAVKDSNVGNQTDMNNKKKVTNKSKETLPKTGEKVNTGIVALGIGLLTSTFFLFVKRNRHTK